MYYKQKPSGKQDFGEWYIDPLTGKRKRAYVTYENNTPRERKRAERELQDKIDDILNANEFNAKKRIKTFGALKDNWLETWQTSVKPRTVDRELLVVRRIMTIMKEDYLLEKMTPLFIQKILVSYEEDYDASPATMAHIKCTLNKIFAHGELYGIVTVSPMPSVRLTHSIKKKQEVKKRKDNKFLEQHELDAFLAEMKSRRNQNYYDLCIFLLYSGLRIGEAGALGEDDIDFENNTVDVHKTLVRCYVSADGWLY